MRPITNFIWLEQYERKLLIKHQVDPAEAEEVIVNEVDKPRFDKVEKGNQGGE